MTFLNFEYKQIENHVILEYYMLILFSEHENPFSKLPFFSVLSDSAVWVVKLYQYFI